MKRTKGDPNGGFGKIPRGMLADPHITPAALKVYGVISTFANCKEIYPSVQTLAKGAALSPRHARRAIRELEGEGWLKAVQRVGESSRYLLLAKDEQFGLFTPDTGVRPDKKSPRTLVSPLTCASVRTKPVMSPLTPVSADVDKVIHVDKGGARKEPRAPRAPYPTQTKPKTSRDIRSEARAAWKAIISWLTAPTDAEAQQIWKRDIEGLGAEAFEEIGGLKALTDPKEKRDVLRRGFIDQYEDAAKLAATQAAQA